jgi:hypothetical protein
LLLQHFFGKNLFDGLLSNNCHYKVEVHFCLRVSNPVQQDLRLDVYSRRFAAEETFYFLEHLQNLERVLAPVVIIVAKFEHQLYLVVHWDSG